MRNFEYISLRYGSKLNEKEMNAPLDRILGKEPKTTRNARQQSMTCDINNIASSLMI